jgi:hypothetical protein
MYVVDTSGTDQTTFCGDVHVETTLPTSDGANTDFTPDTGTTHYTQVDDSTSTFPDGDSTYVASSDVNDKDTYGFADLAILTGTVYAIQTNIYARKDDAATREIAPVIRQGGSDYDGTTVALSTSYAFKSQIYENDPSDSANWTVGKVNSAEFGVKVVT